MSKNLAEILRWQDDLVQRAINSRYQDEAGGSAMKCPIANGPRRLPPEERESCPAISRRGCSDPPEACIGCHLLLTDREREVLQLFMAEKTQPQIAQGLFICAKTVESHLKVIRRKLGVRSTVGLVKLVMERGLMPEVTTSRGAG